MAPYLFLLALAGMFPPPCGPRIEGVRVYRCQEWHGFSTASARSRFEELRGTCPFSHALSPADVADLTQLLARASARRHWQQKIGQNLTFCEFTVAGAPHQVLVHPVGYVLDLTAKREYRVVRPEDAQRFKHVAKAIVGK